MRSTLLFIYGCSFIACSYGFDYCSITCNGVGHTMCRYPEDNYCGRSGLTKSEKHLILMIHNQFRHKVAMGRETRGPQPPATDMKELAWDKESATIAQRWASQCHVNGHDRCRLSRDGANVGQNIAMCSMWGRKPNRSDTIRGMLQDLYDEVKFFPPSLVESLRLSGVSRIGHYTQMVWANTSRVGCGMLESSDERQRLYKYKLVCNYKPAGNVLSYPLYRVGQPCSACRGGRCSSQYTALCLS